MARSAEARKVLADLDSELASASKRRGQKLQWTASEQAVLVLISATIDRKVGLARLYGRAGDDVALRVKLSAELRLLEAATARLLKQVTPDVPVAKTWRQKATSSQAAKAARTRWDRDA